MGSIMTPPSIHPFKKISTGERPASPMGVLCRLFRRALSGLALTGLALVAACPTDTSPEAGDPSKKGGEIVVTVSPVVSGVSKGGTRQFSAMVTGGNNPSQKVTWAVEAGTDTAAGTSISDTGILTVAADETVKSLTVTATSTLDGAKSGTLPS